MDNLIKQIMETGQKLVDEFMATSKNQTRSAMINDQYHLVFTKVFADNDWNACLYDFNWSSHPLLVFGPDVYDPRLKGSDAAYWTPLVSLAYKQFQVIRLLDDQWNVILKGRRFGERAVDNTLIPPVKPTEPPVRVIKNEKVISGGLKEE